VDKNGEASLLAAALMSKENKLNFEFLLSIMSQLVLKSR